MTIKLYEQCMVPITLLLACNRKSNQTYIDFRVRKCCEVYCKQSSPINKKHSHVF